MFYSLKELTFQEVFNGESLGIFNLVSDTMEVQFLVVDESAALFRGQQVRHHCLNIFRNAIAEISKL